MCRGVDHGPESHRVSNLTMKPDILVGREQPLNLGPNHTNDISKHRDENKAAVKGKNETCSTRSPDRPRQSIQGSEFGVGCLKER